MKGSFLDLKNLPERDRRLLFGEPIKGTTEVGKLPTTQEPGKNNESSTDLQHENSTRKAPPKEKCLQRLVIPYNNTFKSIWDIYIMFLICYSSITTAY